MPIRAFAFVGKRFQVLLHTALVVLPLLAFTTILLGLVYWNLWGRRNDADVSLTLSSGYDSEVLYVNYSATSLILVASWSSSVSIPLIGSLLTLISFVVAAELLWISDKPLQPLLPTAAQLGLLTELLDGRKLALWTWFAGFWRRPDQKIPSRWVIDLAVAVQLAGVFFSIAIIASDTWLHVATSSTTLWYLKPVPDPSILGPSYHYSRSYGGTCSSTAIYNPCSVKPDGKSGANHTFFIGDIKDLLTDNPLSDTRINTSADGSLFLAPRLPNQANSGGKDNPSFQTFTAATMGVSVSCDQSLSWCSFSQTNATSGDWQFDCPNGTKGTLTPDNWLSISTWWQPSTSNDAYNSIWAYYEDNFSFETTELGIVAFLQSVNVSTNGSKILNPLNFPAVNGKSSLSGSAIAARCNITTLSTSYGWTNTTTAPAMTSSTVNSTGGALARAALLAGYFNSSNFDQNQKSRLQAGLTGSTNFSESNMVQQVQYVAGLVGLSLLGGTFESTPAVALALANSAIVTQVKKAPLFTLVILNLWYAGFALCLGCLTIYILRDETTSQDIKAIQDLVTINGLATSMVGRHMENLTSKGADARIGVEKVDGKWQFRIFESPGAEEGKALLSTEETAE